MLKKNVIANYLGQGWRAIMSLVFVPLYIKYLGIESYGLIGIFVMLQAWLSLLDLGMKPTLGREMARFTGGGHDTQSIWDLLRSIEIIALCIAVLIVTVIWTTSEWLATDWVQVEKIPIAVVTNSFELMGLVIALRFIENIYTHSISGLQRQVQQNMVVIVMETLRGVGAVVVLVWIESTLDAFFIWQGLISFLTAVIFMIIVYRVLPKPEHAARFSLPALGNVWRFAVGMFGVTLLTVTLTQIDKVLISRLLSLETFGFYVLASLVAGALYILVTPIGTAFYPRFTELFTRKDNQALIKAYHLGAQLVTVLMGSATVILIVFADRILLLWTADPELTNRVTPIMMVLALGTFFNGLMWIPYQMQLAYGWISLSIRINLVAVGFLIPALILIVPIFGNIGAAWVWVTLNAAYCLIGVHYMFRRLLTTEKLAWYLSDILIPLTSSITVGLLCRLIFPVQPERIYELAVVVISLLVTVAAACLAAPIVRRQITGYIKYSTN